MIEGLFQTLHHAVKSGHQIFELIVGARRRQTKSQIGAADVSGGVGDFDDRRQGASGEPPTGPGDQHQTQRHQQKVRLSELRHDVV